MSDMVDKADAWDAVIARGKKDAATIEQLRAEVESKEETIEALFDEMCAIALIVDRSKTDGHSDTDWYRLRDDVAELKARADKAEAALAKVRAAALEAVICAEANCLTKDAPATHRLRASLTEGE